VSRLGVHQAEGHPNKNDPKIVFHIEPRNL
jgi:hypothetical protein